MKIKKEKLKFSVTGDWHANIPYECRQPLPLSKEQIVSSNIKNAIIQLGDSGINYCGQNHSNDIYLKKILNNSGNIFYLLRGNHDANPQALEGAKTAQDPNIGGKIIYEPKYPNIRYFMPFGIYKIQGLTVGVLSGSYSVDKEYRLLTNKKWFKDEQLTAEQKEECAKLFLDQKHFDLILSHTCPLSYQPTDLFLPFIDQSKVDNSMEQFFEYIKENIYFKVLAFGHYHIDRWQKQNVRILYNDIITLTDLMKGDINNDLEISARKQAFL